MLDLVVDRALAAVRLLDVTTRAPVLRPLEVTAEGTRFVRNRRGLYVVTRSSALPNYHRAFPDAPTDVAIESVPLTLAIVDHLGEYLPRLAVIRLPRDADPANAANASSVFRATVVELFPTPSATSPPGAALLRVRVVDDQTRAGLSHAFVRVHRLGAPTQVLGRGTTDARGEAFVPIAGIPTVNWGSDPDNSVLADSVSAVVEAFHDAAMIPPANPTDMEERRATLPVGQSTVNLAPGREAFVTVEISLS